MLAVSLDQRNNQSNLKLAGDLGDFGDMRSQCGGGRDPFLDLMLEHPFLARRVIGVLGSRIRYLSEQLENLMTCGVPTRLLKLLLCLSHDEIAQAKGGPVDVPVLLTQGQIAAMTGSCQQTVSETLAVFEQRGLIAVARRRIRLLDPGAILDALSESSC